MPVFHSRPGLSLRRPLHAGEMPSSHGDSPRRVLAISGSTRSASSSTALCRTATRCGPDGAVVTAFEGLASLPHFNPDDDHDPLPDAVAALRAAIARADAVLISTPEHAGTLPGSVKNLLDWTVGGTEMTGKPVAWVNVAPDPRRGAGAASTLRTVLGYVGARLVDRACTHVPITSQSIDAHGLATDPATRSAVVTTLTILLAAGRQDSH